MPHCKRCDVELTDFEATRKDLQTNAYLDLCTPCFIPISGEVAVRERWDLYGDADIDEDTFDEYNADVETETYSED